MENNNTNPAPVPTPEPVTPEPVQAPAAAETPVVAETPVATEVPATAPAAAPAPAPAPAFVTATPTAPAPAETPVEKPKKDNRLFIALITSFIVVAVFAAAAAVIYFADNKKQEEIQKNSSARVIHRDEYDEEEEETPSQNDLDAQEINTEIQNDVKRVAVAITQYQANNRGAIPTVALNNSTNTGIPETRTWQYFINNYLDMRDYDPEDNFVETYKIEVCDFYEGTCKKPADLTWAQDKYVIYIATKSTCSTTGEAQMSDGNRHVAVYSIKKPYSNMTQSYFCANN